MEVDPTPMHLRAWNIPLLNYATVKRGNGMRYRRKPLTGFTGHEIKCAIMTGIPVRMGYLKGWQRDAVPRAGDPAHTVSNSNIIASCE